ncbi:hypothetical protein [Leifsonia sp. fls2-241-R2A-40a]|uniref:hypothetical protein n=1 Tax=Leifsonia sp. fls2-241-R2A-40a TaxID=3040290 RepID=UPI00254BC813|nr:hypothetical protein [Leifsonia sp. fls2-241-R2A-40a]
MPALPISYLDTLGPSLPAELLRRLSEGWLDPDTLEAVVTHLRSGSVPAEVHALYMDLLVRFGRSPVSVLRDILPLVGAFHLKFWDLDDDGHRVSQPLRELGAILRAWDFAGTLCSEWGGHGWLDDDPADMTREHLALARSAFAESED